MRAGVRTLTLSVYSIRDDLVRNFVMSPPASHYFRHLSMYLTEQCQVSLDSSVGLCIQFVELPGGAEPVSLY